MLTCALWLFPALPLAIVGFILCHIPICYGVYLYAKRRRAQKVTSQMALAESGFDNLLPLCRMAGSQRTLLSFNLTASQLCCSYGCSQTVHSERARRAASWRCQELMVPVLAAQEEEMKRKEGLLDERPWGADVLQAYMDKHHDA